MSSGTLSPTPSGTTQADAYRPLRLPVVLVGDSKLGGISTTLAAYETLHTRGYDIHAVLMFKNDYYQNHTYLAQWFKERGVALAAFDPPPPQAPRSRNDQQDESNMKSYYAHTASTSDAKRVIATLDERHKERIRAFETLPRRAASTFWYPFSQHKHIKSTQDLTIIDSAHGDVFTTAKHQLNNPSLLSPTFDGSASWWTQGVGHGNHTLTAVAANAAGRYGHVIFPRAIHEPAIELAERMLRSQGEGWASRVFFSDNGSTGMEVALKMALRTTSMLYPPGEKPDLEVLGLAGSYHGDTIGAMDACEGGVYNSTVEWYKGRGAWLQTPTVGFEDGHLRLRIPWLKERPQLSIGDVYDVSKRREGMLAEKYREYIIAQIQELVTAGRRFGGLVLEPLVLGAGGMKFVDPLFQAILVDVVRNNSHLLLPPTARDATLPVIFDEVFSGLGRLGFSSSSSVLGVKPDIAVYAKLLTGGLVPLAVTLASQRIFDVFLGDEKASALLHGHSYTAYPLGCAVANASLSILEEALRSEAFDKARKDWSPALDTMAGSEPIDPSTPGSLWSRSFVNSLSRLPSINWAMSLGTVLAFELKDMDSGSSFHTPLFLANPVCRRTVRIWLFGCGPCIGAAQRIWLWCAAGRVGHAPADVGKRRVSDH